MIKIRTPFAAIVASCLLLTACVTPGTGPAPTPTDTPAPTAFERADAAVAQAQAAYDRAKLFADVLMPLLPSSYQARLVSAEIAVERALAAARAAVLLADQLAALRRAELALADIAAITGAK